MKTNTYTKLLLTLICSAIVIFGLSIHSYNLDEAYSIVITRDWSSLLHTLWYTEANMWLYYVLLQIWSVLGTHEATMRSLSVLFSLGSLYAIYTLGKKLYSESVGLLATLFMGMNMFFVYYAQEARGYALALFFVTTASYLLVRSQNEKGMNRYAAGYILASALGMYAHFYTGLVILAHVVWLWTEKKLATYTPHFIAITALTIPIWVAPSIRGGQVDWVMAPTLKNIAGTLVVLTGDHPLLTLVYVGMGIAWAYTQKKKKHVDSTDRFLLLWLGVPIVAAFSFSLLVKPIYESVYLIVCLPPVMLLAARCIMQVTKRWVRILLITTICLLSLIRLVPWYQQDNRAAWVLSNKEEDWKSAGAHIERFGKDTDVLMFYGYYGRVPYSMYAGDRPLSVVEISSGPYLLGGGAILPEPDIQKIEGLRDPRIWLVLNRFTGTKLDRFAQSSSVISAVEKRYTLTSVTHFEKIDVRLYTLK